MNVAEASAERCAMIYFDQLPRPAAFPPSTAQAFPADQLSESRLVVDEWLDGVDPAKMPLFSLAELNTDQFDKGLSQWR